MVHLRRRHRWRSLAEDRFGMTARGGLRIPSTRETVIQSPLGEGAQSVEFPVSTSTRVQVQTHRH